MIKNNRTCHRKLKADGNSCEHPFLYLATTAGVVTGVGVCRSSEAMAP
jgi:hypothetical protein